MTRRLIAAGFALAAAVGGAVSASAADLYRDQPDRYGSAYDDPRYADLYGKAPPPPPVYAPPRQHYGQGYGYPPIPKESASPPPTSSVPCAKEAGTPQPRFPASRPRRPRPYLSIPLQTLPGHTPNDASVGDLDGDGEYEIVAQAGAAAARQLAGRARPASRSSRPTSSTARSCGGSTSGKNIREGAHYTQFLVYDLDGDGRAEVVCKTADGTDRRHRARSSATPTADHRNARRATSSTGRSS